MLLLATADARAQQPALRPRPARPSVAAAPDGGAPPPEPVVDVVVVAPRRREEKLADAPVAVTVVDRAQIETSGARDAADALATQPGLQLTSSFAGAGLLLQGLDPQHTLILVDGERLVGMRDGVLDLTRIYAADIEQIEIVRGPASAAYGSDAMAGVVNIATRPPAARLALSGQGRYGLTPGTRRAHGGLTQHGDAWLSATSGGPRVRSRLSGGYRRAGGFDLHPETPATTGSRFDAYAGFARIDWLAAAGLRVPLNLRYARKQSRAVDESTAGAVYDRTQRTDDVALSLAPRLRLGAHTLQLTASYALQRAQLLRDQRGDDDGDSYEDAREQLGTLRAQADLQPRDDLGVSAGLELLAQRYASPRIARRGERARVSPYVELSWKLSRACQCSVTPSARLDWDTQFGVNVSPRLSLRADPVQPLTLRASVGRGFRAPNFSELLLDFSNAAVGYRVRGNPALDPERSLGANVSASWRVVDGIEASLSVFRNELWDLIDTDLVEVVAGEQQYRSLNRSRARTQGIESTLSTRAGRWLTLEVSYTLTEARDLALKRDLPGRARHRGTGRVVIGDAARDWSVSARCQLVGKRRYFDAAEMSGGAAGADAPLHAVADARAAYRATRQLELFASTENLGDVRPRNAPLRPTTVYAGLNLSY